MLIMGLNNPNNAKNVYLEAGSHNSFLSLSDSIIRPREHIKSSLSTLEIGTNNWILKTDHVNQPLSFKKYKNSDRQNLQPKK